MKNYLLTASLALIFCEFIGAQITITDSLTWGAGSPVNSQSSPTYPFCDQTNVYFQVSTTSSGGFQNVTATSNPNITHGLIFPAVTSSTSTTQIPISLSFSQPVSNLRILFYDLDENVGSPSNPEEYIDGFSTAPSSVTPTSGIMSWNGNAIVPTGNDVDGWAEWNVDLSNLSFIYHRPGSGYGLVIGIVEFSCDSTFVPEEPEPIDTTADCTLAPEMPNIFTPDGDQTNDFFEPIANPCDYLLNVTVVNRWGNTVFSALSKHPKWDGTDASGKNISEGTYFWLIEYVDNVGIRQQEHGFVTLAK